MRNQIISDFEAKHTANTPKKPKFRPGDTLRVDYEIREGTDQKKFRVQSFEGVCIRYRKGLSSSTFTVRKIGANGVGVERVFPFHSPSVKDVKVIARGIVRRSRLYYLRDLSGKSARIKSKYGNVTDA